MGDKRSVLITGSLRGIGRACAVKLSSIGYKVVLGYRGDENRALAFKREIEEAGGDADIIRLDVSDRVGAMRSIEEYLSSNPVFYGVVLNAGIARDNVFPLLEDDDWDDVMRTDLDGFYNVLKPLFLPMRRKKEGRIVVLSSLSGVIGNRGQVNYSAAKAGLIGAAKALSLELAGKNITVNAIAPGLIETEMTENLPKDELKKMIPLGRFGKAEEVASLVAFLLSDDAGYITRQVISINGGLS